MARLHLKEDAQLWYQLIKADLANLSWDEFKRQLHNIFGPSEFDNLFMDLIYLKQTGSVQEYQAQFFEVVSMMW